MLRAGRGSRVQLRHKAPLVILVAASGIFGVVNYVAYRSQTAYVDDWKGDQLRDIANELSSMTAGLGRGASMYAELVAALPTVQQLLKDRDRDRLAKELGPTYRNQRAKYGVEQGSFQVPELKTFLRLSRPEVFGEDVSHRDMMVKANTEKKSQSGLETSTSRVSVRAVVPVTSNGEHVGSFEWGVGFSRLLQRIKEKHESDLALLVDERTFTAPITTAGQAARAAAAKAAEGERILDGYRTVESTAIDLMKVVVPKDALANLTTTTITTRYVQGVEHGLVSLPISDYGGRKLGAIFVAKSMAGPQRQVRSMRVTFTTVTLVGLIFLAGAVQLVFNGLLLRPLGELGENVDTVGKGDLGVKVDLKKRTDEIGDIARAFDAFRDRLVKEKEAAERADKVSARIAKIEDSAEPDGKKA
jgi:methyl-accepting chemotaxis protein